MSKFCPLCNAVTNCTDNCKSCLEEEAKASEETMNIPTIGSNSCGETLYRVYIATGTAWLKVFQAYAYNEQEAVDMVADYCEEHELCGLYLDHDEIADEWEENKPETEQDEPATKHIEAHNLICCGNHGIYLDVAGIETVK